MRKNFIIIFIVIILVLIAVFVYQNRQNNQNNQIISDTIKIGQSSFKIEIASTDREHKLGLSGKDSIPEDFGLFFIFEKPDKYGIWMKDMKFSIDILWINENNKIVSIEKNISPKTFPKVFYPASLSKYVLELNAGIVNKEKIKVGDIVDF